MVIEYQSFWQLYRTRQIPTFLRPNLTRQESFHIGPVQPPEWLKFDIQMMRRALEWKTNFAFDSLTDFVTGTRYRHGFQWINWAHWDLGCLDHYWTQQWTKAKTNGTYEVRRSSLAGSWPSNISPSCFSIDMRRRIEESRQARRNANISLILSNVLFLKELRWLWRHSFRSLT